MKKAVLLTGFIAVITGTIGLLLNDFVLKWGTAVTLTFAAIDLLGIIALACGISGLYGIVLPVFPILIIIFGAHIVLEPMLKKKKS